MQVSRVDRNTNFNGGVLAMIQRKNNFSDSVVSIYKDLDSVLVKKDYNVLFSNSTCNDIHTIAVVDDTLSGGKSVEKTVYNYSAIKPKELLTLVSGMMQEYEVSNKYNSLGNKIRRFFSRDRDEFSLKLKNYFRLKQNV